MLFCILGPGYLSVVIYPDAIGLLQMRCQLKSSYGSGYANMTLDVQPQIKVKPES